MNRRSFFRMTSQLLASSKDKLGPTLSRLWIHTVEEGFSVMEASIRWMLVEWQYWHINSKLSKTSLIQSQKNGNLHQCYFYSVECIQCGNSGTLRHGTGGIGFVACDDCFKYFFTNIYKSKDMYGVKLFYPFSISLLRSTTMSDAIRFVVDFTIDNDDKVRSKKWKKRLPKILLRHGERNF